MKNDKDKTEKALLQEIEQLKESKDRLYNILTSMDELIFVFDGEGRFTFHHAAHAEDLFLSPGEFLGKKCIEVMPSHMKEPFIGAFERNKKGEMAEYEYWLELGGKLRWYAARLSPVFDKDQFKGAIGVVRDITERKKVEQDLRDANMRLSDALTEIKHTHQQIIQHERLSALGQMASGIAHDFNNALMPILGYSELLLTDVNIMANRDEANVILNDIHSAAKDATQIVRRLREFYRPPDDGERVSVDFAELIETAVMLTQPKWREEMNAKGITIEIKKELQKIPEIRGTVSQLREVLTNLILNSIDAMPNGGTITICARPEGEWGIVEVRDTGFGMTEDVQQRCFEPFFSTKGNHGTGMGLALAYGIVRQHGGTISIESKQGEGTTVKFSLPTALAIPEEEKETAKLAQVPPLNVLIIDDDLWSHNILKRYLAAQKHTIETAETGQEGLEKFRKGQFDLVITDRAMPDMSGDDVAAAIKEANSKIRVILATGFGEIMKDKRECPPGVDVIVSKPVTEQELKRAVAKAVARE